MLLFKYLTLFVFFLHMCFIDIEMWKENKFPIPPWMTDDWSYLGGTIIVFFMMSISMGFTSFWIILSNATFFSLMWDWIYGWYQDHDVLYPFENWFNNWGFKNRKQRIIFDIGRFIFVVIFRLF